MAIDFDKIIHVLLTNEGMPSTGLHCDTYRISPNELFNAVALEIARRFDSDHMGYEDADFAMNVLFSMMIENLSQSEDNSELAEPAYSIYDAFDGGEYSVNDEDPVERYTKPAIKRILAKA